ncbi:uncharacterized protein LOC110238771 [Exaiptasia diaphana]|uniref:Uncharacterized protein n=1 Tax=Exaiptasia diaphana TaxID=2652724 RepID=A0A913YI61_EXADI|nr:uncharacterized protein LOC110238771 [Exaiptasia diaphana]
MVKCSDEPEESSKVKELGKKFQGATKDVTSSCSKESQAEKSPVSVRRYKEIFEHGELLLSPAAYAAAPDGEVTSPRPGIVKSMCDLFENPKNFEWPEGTKRTTAVN